MVGIRSPTPTRCDRRAVRRMRSQHNDFARGGVSKAVMSKVNCMRCSLSWRLGWWSWRLVEAAWCEQNEAATAVWASRGGTIDGGVFVGEGGWLGVAGAGVARK